MKVTCLLLLLGLLFNPLRAEERYFRFQDPGRDALSQITRLISIDKVDNGWVYAYANDKGWEQFSPLGYEVESLAHPGSLNSEICGNKLTTTWDQYPSYTAYVDMMQNYQTRYPNLCEIQALGKTIKGRALLAAKLTGSGKGKPKFFYTSSIHGDETAGYVLLLRLVDYLLSNYNQPTSEGQRVTNLLNTMEIWINPLANPDGTYRSSDTSIQNPTRGNAAGVDLNRNFPDPQDGDHADGESWQPETLAMMELAKEQRFTMAANMHGGAEVLNWPWDCWSTRHVDDRWWQAICRRYADNVHAVSPSSYLDDLDNGITNGNDWYEVHGGRQDYTNYFVGCRELTLELSATKFLPSSQFPAFWGYHKNALLTYMEEALKGVRGTVTDEQSGNPLSATVSLQAANEMPVTTDPQTGSFFRVLLPGTYTFTVTSEGYETKTLSNITVTSGSATDLEVKLGSNHPAESVTANFTFTQGSGNTVQFSDASTCTNGVIKEWAWDFGDGTSSDVKNPLHTYAQTGTYTVKLTVTTQTNKTDSLTKSVQVSGEGHEYCPVKSTNARYFYINNFQVGGFSNPSSYSNYSDFTSKVIELTPGVSVDFVIGCGGQTGSRNMYAIWVDLNQDGDFNDMGEQLYTSGSGITGSARGSITVPIGTAKGLTRMRIIQRYGNVVQPCESFTYGEVEDYTVEIK